MTNEKLRAWRGKLTQEQAARHLDITHCYYCRLERGRDPISRKIAAKLASITLKPEEYWRS